MFCSQCGTELGENAKFCKMCGAPVNKKVKQAEDNTVPEFTPPQNDITSNVEIPGLKKMGKKDEIPTFVPPEAPTFIPPEHHGPMCYHHTDEPAVTQCVRCGKPICKDCAEAYGVTSGEYAGKCLCYDCCQQLVAENVENLTRNKNKIKAQFILSLIGIGIGFLIGLSSGIEGGSFGTGIVVGLIYGCIGGVFLSALKAFGSLAWEGIKIAFAGQFGVLTILSLLFHLCVLICQCIWRTCSNTFYYINYLSETSGFIEADSEALQQMRDYMEYTLVRNSNKGVDLDVLMKEGSALYNNSYAQSVQSNGEEFADAALRQATTTIAENGEIIRSFAA